MGEMVKEIVGVVIKATAGFYYVKVEDGDLWECSLRGKFRLDKNAALVGDKVLVKPRHGQVGVIEKIFPRNNELVRPPISNIEQALIVFSLREPKISILLLDRFLIQVAHSKVGAIICFNKMDLIKEEDLELIKIYQDIGYKVINTSTYLGEGIEALRENLKGKITVLAGPSGVGKSSLINKIQHGLSLKTGEVGNKLRRGKHTTRHVELLPLNEGGFVADTPGFSNLWLPSMKREDLKGYFPEMEKLALGCRFRGCLHVNEPDCRVKEALAKKKINQGRYDNYLLFLEEVKNMEAKY